MLTQEDIEFIQLLIDERIANTKASFKPRVEKDYHTTYDIRDLIRQTLPKFREWTGTGSFQISMLRHFLSMNTTMRARDLEPAEAGNKGHTTRFDQQVANAIQTWTDGPFRKTTRAGHYEIIDPFQLNLTQTLS